MPVDLVHPPEGYSLNGDVDLPGRYTSGPLCDVFEAAANRQNITFAPNQALVVCKTTISSFTFIHAGFFPKEKTGPGS